MRGKKTLWSLNWIINSWTWLILDYCYQKIRDSPCLSLHAWLTEINCWVCLLSGVINAGQTQCFPAELRSDSPPRTPTTLEFITSAPADSREPEVTSSAVLNRMMRSRLPHWRDGFRLAKNLEKIPISWRPRMIHSRWETLTHTLMSWSTMGEKAHVITFKVCT